MYSESAEDLNEGMLKLQQEAEDYPNFWARFEVFFPEDKSGCISTENICS